jgi:hypothetical protein
MSTPTTTTTTTENITRTVYGAVVQTTLFLDQLFDLVQNTTLNEKFGVQQGVSSSVTPTLNYYGIGIGGHTMTAGTDGIYLPTPLEHEPTDAALFKHLPFVLRLPTNDLSQAEQAAYAMRTTLTVGGVNYIAYYLKRLDYSTTQVQMQLKSVASDGTVSTTTFTPTTSNLNPVANPLATSGVNLTTGDYVTSTAKVTIAFTVNDITELLNAANIIYGDPSYALISELCLVSGVDKPITVTTTTGASYTFLEAIMAQVASFVNTLIPVRFLNSEVDIVLDLGATEALLTTTTSTPTP